MRVYDQIFMSERVWRVSWREGVRCRLSSVRLIEGSSPCYLVQLFSSFFSFGFSPFISYSFRRSLRVTTEHVFNTLASPHHPLSYKHLWAHGRGLALKFNYNAIKNNKERNSQCHQHSERRGEGEKKKTAFFVYFDLFLIVFWYWSTTDA